MEWTSQIYFDNSINQQVHSELPYSNQDLLKLVMKKMGFTQDLQQMA
jgi:hypothetical protein